MNAFKALGDDCTNAQQQWAFGRPVARATRAVLLARDNEQGYTLLLVAHRGLVDSRLFSIRQMDCIVPLLVRGQVIAQANIAKGAAYHHLVITTSRPIGVEVTLLNALLNEVTSRRAGRRETACRRDMVRGDGVIQHG